MINYVYDKIWLYHEGQGGEEETNDQSDIRSVAHHQPQPTTEGDGIRLVPSTFYKEKSQILMRYGVFVVKQMTAFFFVIPWTRTFSLLHTKKQDGGTEDVDNADDAWSNQVSLFLKQQKRQC